MSVDRPRPLVAGNWKMNGLKALGRGAGARSTPATRPASKAKVELAVCPPATLIGLPSPSRPSARGIAIGGQDCHAKESGAFTGDLSAEMLADAGATYVHRRPFRAAAVPWRDGRGCPRQGRGRPPGGPHGHRLRRRDAGGARGRQDPRRRPRAAARLDPGGSRRPQPRRRLRARLGHRHRPDPDRGRRRRGPCRSSATSCAASSARPSRPGPDPLRRLGEALERGRADGGRRTSTAPWSAAPASSRRISSASPAPIGPDAIRARRAGAGRNGACGSLIPHTPMLQARRNERMRAADASVRGRLRFLENDANRSHHHPPDHRARADRRGSAAALRGRRLGSAAAGGGVSGFMTGRGQANALTRATAILAALFFVTSIALTVMATYGRGAALDPRRRRAGGSGGPAGSGGAAGRQRPRAAAAAAGRAAGGSRRSGGAGIRRPAPGGAAVPQSQ